MSCNQWLACNKLLFKLNNLSKLKYFLCLFSDRNDLAPIITTKKMVNINMRYSRYLITPFPIYLMSSSLIFSHSPCGSLHNLLRIGRFQGSFCCRFWHWTWNFVGGNWVWAKVVHLKRKGEDFSLVTETERFKVNMYTVSARPWSDWVSVTGCPVTACWCWCCSSLSGALHGFR